MMTTQYHPQAIHYARAGLLAIQAGHYTKSKALLTRAVQLEPRLGEAWRWLAALHSGARQAICLQHAQQYLTGATLPTLPEPKWLPPEEPYTNAEEFSYGTNKRWQAFGLAATGLLAASLIAMGSFEIAYADRMYPGVSAFGVSLSGLETDEAITTLAPILSVWQHQTLTLRIDGQEWPIELGKLADFSAETISTQAYNYGRKGSLSTQLQQKSTALLQPTALQTPHLNQTGVTEFLNTIATQIDVPATSAAYIQDQSGVWQIQPEQTGYKLDRTAAQAALSEAWEHQNWQTLPQNLELELTRSAIQPAVFMADLQTQLGQLNQQTATPLQLQIGAEQITIERSAFLQIDQQPIPGKPFQANRSAIEQYIHNLALTYNQQAQPSMLERQGNYATAWRLAQEGHSLDQHSSARLIAQALESNQNEPLNLPIQITKPVAGELEALGITDIIGEGKSQFSSYSSPNRDANVSSGGKEFDGLLVAPGETLSFNMTVGEITADKGYQMGEMISGGTVVPSYGGGICQVSTTLFRAAFWAGLPIEERHNHSWRLAWYETDAPVGMDATIAIGGPDLKIKNTTTGYLLIDVETDLVHKTQTFTLYGTDPAVDVAMVGPDWSSGGVIITRRISQHNTVIKEDHWISYYAQ